MFVPATCFLPLAWAKCETHEQGSLGPLCSAPISQGRWPGPRGPAGGPLVRGKVMRYSLMQCSWHAQGRPGHLGSTVRDRGGHHSAWKPDSLHISPWTGACWTLTAVEGMAPPATQSAVEDIMRRDFRVTRRGIRAVALDCGLKGPTSGPGAMAPVYQPWGGGGVALRLFSPPPSQDLPTSSGPHLPTPVILWTLPSTSWMYFAH